MVRSPWCYAALASLSVGTAHLAAQESRSYSAVTDARLESPEPGNWLMYLRQYDSWSYSPLSRITTRNVADLAPVWTMSTGTTEGHQAPPIVNDGIMFVTTPFNQVLAIDAKTGDLLWRYRHQMPADIRMGHPTNRGVALYGDKVYTATSDARVVALDAKTGAVVWNKAVEDYNKGYYMTIAPLAARGRIMVGVSGGERGIRGFVVALDAQTGEQVWKSYTVPAPGEPGNETWPGDSWRTGGAPVWVTGSFDPDARAHVLGHRQPGPVDGRRTARRQPLHELRRRARHRDRRAEGLSPVSLERLVGLGRGRGATAHRLTAQRPHGARARACRPQRLSLDARTQRHGHLVHQRAAVREAERLHEARSRHGPARVRHGTQTRHRQAGDLLPVALGRQGLAAGRVQPRHGLSYTSPPTRTSASTSSVKTSSIAPASNSRARRPSTSSSTRTRDHIGELQAWNLRTGKKAWTQEFESPNWGPVMTTGGGLVFSGGTNDRYFRAFDAATGRILWQYRTNSGITGVPTSFEIDGVQYIAVQSGWGVDAQGMTARIDRARGTETIVPQGGVIWVFALRR